MIKGTLTLALDGSFGKQHPTHEKFSMRVNVGGSEAGWVVVTRGPRYINHYRVDEVDEAGAAWLAANERLAPTEEPNAAL